MYDQNTQRPRGFGFITFDTEDAVDGVLQKNYHELNGKLVEVKRALPKDANPGGGGPGGGYQGYSASRASTNAFDGRIDSSRYVQPQTTAGGFPPYSGHGAPAYGYGAANTRVGYRGYGSYGLGGYGSANIGFGGPAGSYGNPNAPNAGYVSGVPGGLKNTWSNQTLGFGATGYGLQLLGVLPTEVVFLLLLGVNHQVELLVMEIKVMVMEIMAGVTLLILVGMGPLAGVVEVPQQATRVVLVVESNKGLVVVTWGAAMTTPMVIQGTLMHRGDLTLHRPPVAMVVLSPGRPNIRDSGDFEISFTGIPHACALFSNLAAYAREELNHPETGWIA